MVLNKRIIQKEVENTIKDGKYTEGLGKIILLFAEVSAHKRGLNYRYNEFEVEFIIKPRIVDMLLLKVFRYDSTHASAYTFFSLVTATAILDSIKDIRRAERGETTDVFYIEDMKTELSKVIDLDYLYDQNDVYLDGNIIKLK